jgi:hypothetical protein
MKIDFKKYKRFFTFGCSFTEFRWPTWADIISKEMPDAEFYNFGRSGAGNLLIHLRLMEADARFKFCETDLVMVMFTSYTREDRWVELHNGWYTPGNIYCGSNYPEAWKKEFTDERGFMIRDAAIIHSTVNFLENSPATTHAFLSNYFLTEKDFRTRTTTETKDIIDVYEDTLSKLPMPLHNYETNRDWSRDYFVKDGHPSPVRYYEYLLRMGVNLTNVSRDYAAKSSVIVREGKSIEDITNAFPDCQRSSTLSRTLMF